MPWVMCEVGGSSALRVESDTLDGIAAQMLVHTQNGRVPPGSVWGLSFLVDDPDAIAVVDSQHGALIDP